MYLIHIWTINPDKDGQQSLSAYQIPKNFADILVSISDGRTLPLISELSYVD